MSPPPKAVPPFSRMPKNLSPSTPSVEGDTFFVEAPPFSEQTRKTNRVHTQNIHRRSQTKQSTPTPTPAASGSARREGEEDQGRPGAMQRQLELAALGVAIAGWLCAILTRCLALWTVSGTVDNVTATLPAYWDGVWLEWDHWDLSHDGSLHCSFYQSLMSLSGNFRTWRALVMAAIGAGSFATAIGVTGVVWFPAFGLVFSGTLFVLSGLLLLVPTAWTCHLTGQPLEGAVLLRRDWGPALYLGWISLVLMVAGGAVLTTRCRAAGAGGAGGVQSPTKPDQQDCVDF
ncbi:claudin-4-like [Pseudoliparis swirei]|uniref:claudin-4-like n=1 Tax=Pseudoliparis swirei TaxID=2059687 RepID=UPI0024BD5D63|nr:claudin-4-like [Pseudoliparis swirei]